MQMTTERREIEAWRVHNSENMNCGENEKELFKRTSRTRNIEKRIL